MISAPNRVLIWQSQLSANDFPPVCAMTGAPAETWRKFTFTTTPPWAFFGGAIIAYALSRRARGYLPLTRASTRKLTLFTLLFIGLIPLAVVFWVGSAVTSSFNDPIWSAVTALLLMLGFSSILIGLIGVVVARRTLGPTGKVFEQQPGHYQPLIELRNVHPNFVVAVQRLQQARAQSAYAAPSPLQTKWG